MYGTHRRVYGLVWHNGREREVVGCEADGCGGKPCLVPSPAIKVELGWSVAATERGWEAYVHEVFERILFGLANIMQI